MHALAWRQYLHTVRCPVQNLVQNHCLGKKLPSNDCFHNTYEGCGNVSLFCYRKRRLRCENCECFSPPNDPVDLGELAEDRTPSVSRSPLVDDLHCAFLSACHNDLPMLLCCVCYCFFNCARDLAWHSCVDRRRSSCHAACRRCPRPPRH